MAVNERTVFFSKFLMKPNVREKSRNREFWDFWACEYETEIYIFFLLVITHRFVTLSNRVFVFDAVFSDSAGNSILLAPSLTSRN